MPVSAKEAPGIRGHALLRLPLPVLVCVALTACASGGASLGAGAPAPSATPTPTPTPAVAAPPEDDASTDDIPTVGGFDGGTVRLGFSGEASSVRDTVIRESPIRIWGVLPDVFRTLGVPARTVDPATYTIGLETGRVSRIEGRRLSLHLECGNGILGPNADHYDVTMTLLVRLMSAGTGTRVRTTLDAYARPRSASGNSLHCGSSRTLERRVMELVQMQLSGVAPRAPTVVSRSRIPVTGDHLRVECVSPSDPVGQVGEGSFLGAASGELILGVGTTGGVVGVPAANVTSVQVRERSSRSTIVGLFAGLAGGVAGGLWGSKRFDSRVNGDRRDHYGRGVYVTVGALGGAIGSYFLGRIVGSFIRTDAWIDAPNDWTLRYASVDPSGDSSAASPGCPSFSAGR